MNPNGNVFTIYLISGKILYATQAFKEVIETTDYRTVTHFINAKTLQTMLEVNSDCIEAIEIT